MVIVATAVACWRRASLLLVVLRRLILEQLRTGTGLGRHRRASVLTQQSSDSGTRLMVLAPAGYLSSDTSTDWSDAGAHSRSDAGDAGTWSDAGAAWR